MMDRASFDGHAEGGPNSQGALERDNTMLVDMLETSTIRSLTGAFAETNNVAIGIFTPDGKRLGGKPVQHCEYCNYIYTSPQGFDGCQECDIEHIPKGAGIVKPYRCHANLLDFSVPIVARRDNRRVLIGAMFAGQLRPTEHMSKEDIDKLRSIAEKYGLDFDPLLAKYDERPYFEEAHVERIQGFMKALADVIGQMVTRRYEQHSLMQQVSKMGKPEDVTVAIADFMGADACSMFTQNVGEPGRIYLRATSFEPLQRDIGKAFYEAGEGLTAWVYRNNCTLNVADVHDTDELNRIDPNLHWLSKVWDVGQTESIRSFLAVPIWDDRRRCVGVIRAIRTKPGGFSQLQQETFEAIADMARRIVELAKSQEERQIILSVAKGVLAGNPLKDVINSSMKQAMRLFEHCAENIWITRYLPTDRQFEIVDCYQAAENVEVGTRFSEDQGIAGWMLHHRRKILFSNDLSKAGIESIVKSVKACIVYSIMFGDEFFGIFTVASSRTGVFNDNDAKQLEWLGAHVTSAFENARLFEQTQKEQATLNDYFQCLNNIANLPPPWQPRLVTERVCQELQSVGFTAIRAEVHDETKEDKIGWGWEKVPGEDHYQEVTLSSISDENKETLRLCEVASNGGAIATVELSPREGETTFTGVDRMCLGLAERLAAGRLRDEAELASTVTSSIGASTHNLRKTVANVRDRIDEILDSPRAPLPEAVRDILNACQERLQSAVEWCATSELLSQYRRGTCPTQDEFSEMDLRDALPPMLETYQRLEWEDLDAGDVPSGTMVQVDLPSLRRVIDDLVQNAEEHGIRDGARRVTLRLVEREGRNRVRVSVSNAVEAFTSQMAAQLQEKAKTPERMLINAGFGVGTQLAAVIAKMHGDCLEVEAEDGFLTFSFTLPVCPASPILVR